MKKFLSLTLAFVMLVSTMSIASFNAFAYSNMNDAPEYKVGDSFSITYDSLKSNSYEYYAKFVPEETAFYEFNMADGVGKIAGEVRAFILDSKGNTVCYDFMDEDFPDAIAPAAELKQGQIYYFAIVAEKCGTYSTTVTLKNHIHTIEREIDPAFVLYDPRDPEYNMFENGAVKDICTTCINYAELEYGYEQVISTIYCPKTMTLSTTTYTYNGSVKKPSVTIKDSKGNVVSKSNYKVSYSNNKNVGKGVVTVEFVGDYYSGEFIKTITINPASTKITSISAKSKGFTVKWSKKTTQTTGYQIQCATDSKYTKNKKTVTVSKNSTTSKTVTGLKPKKKYYVRVRTYKTVNGKKYYSSWSSSKTITTKR